MVIHVTIADTQQIHIYMFRHSIGAFIRELDQP
jgi:hypothetical protein